MYGMRILGKQRIGPVEGMDADFGLFSSDSRTSNGSFDLFFSADYRKWPRSRALRSSGAGVTRSGPLGDGWLGASVECWFSGTTPHHSW